MDTHSRGNAPRRGLRQAFTLIELLTVIAIIAVLAAILFPIFGTVREQARQSNTLSNLQSIYMFAKTYYDDEGHYPSALFGYAEIHDTSVNPAVDRLFGAPGDDPGKRGQVTPIDKINKGYLYREHSKSFNIFTNTDNLINDKRAVTTTVWWPLASPLANGKFVKVTWQAPGATWPDGCPVTPDSDLPAGFVGGEPKYFYKMDSADIGPMLDDYGRQVTGPDGNPAYELHYTPDWTHRLGTLCDTLPDPVTKVNKPVVSQLKYKNPPTDRTIITYETDHAATTGSPSVIALLSSGTARKVNYKKANNDPNAPQLPLNYQP